MVCSPIDYFTLYVPYYYFHIYLLSPLPFNAPRFFLLASLSKLVCATSSKVTPESLANVATYHKQSPSSFTNSTRSRSSGVASQVNASRNSNADAGRSQVNASDTAQADGIMSQVNASQKSTASHQNSVILSSFGATTRKDYTITGGYGDSNFGDAKDTTFEIDVKNGEAYYKKDVYTDTDRLSEKASKESLSKLAEQVIPAPNWSSLTHYRIAFPSNPKIRIEGKGRIVRMDLWSLETKWQINEIDGKSGKEVFGSAYHSPNYYAHMFPLTFNESVEIEVTEVVLNIWVEML